jgi:hypothetical protein
MHARGPRNPLDGGLAKEKMFARCQVICKKQSEHFCKGLMATKPDMWQEVHVSEFHHHHKILSNTG